MGSLLFTLASAPTDDDIWVISEWSFSTDSSMKSWIEYWMLVTLCHSSILGWSQRIGRLLLHHVFSNSATSDSSHRTSRTLWLSATDLIWQNTSRSSSSSPTSHRTFHLYLNGELAFCVRVYQNPKLYTICTNMVCEQSPLLYSRQAC